MQVTDKSLVRTIEDIQLLLEDNIKPRMTEILKPSVIESTLNLNSSDEELEFDPKDQANVCYNPRCKKICNKFDVHL